MASVKHKALKMYQIHSSKKILKDVCVVFSVQEPLTLAIIVLSARLNTNG